MDEPLYAPVHPPPSVVTTDSELSSLPVKRLQRHSDLDNLTTLQDRYARTRSNLEQSNAMIDNVMTIDTIPLTPPGKSSSEVQSPRRSLTVTKKWPLQDSRLQITIMTIQLNVPIKRPYIKLTLGDQTFSTSVSEYQEGRWYEGFELKVSYHAQLFDTIHMDLYDRGTFFSDRHVGRAEIRLRHLEGLPEVFTSYYEIWDKKLSSTSSSAVGRRKILSANIGAIQSRIYYRYQKDNHNIIDKAPNLRAPGLYVTTSQSLVTEEQITSEFERHLKYQRERDKTGITFRKYEENNASGENNLDNYEEYEDMDYDDVDDDEINLSRPLSSKPEKKSSEATLTEDKAEQQPKIRRSWSSMLGLGGSKPATDVSASSTRTSSSATLRNVNAIGGKVDDDEALKSYPLLDTLGSWATTKETNQVLRSIGKLLAAFGQGFELSHLQVLTGFTVLEKFYAEQPKNRTWDLVTDLGEIEPAAHFWKFSIAAYGWKGLTFIGKSTGILTNATRKHSDALSIVEYLSLPKEDLLAYEFRTGEVFRPSYFIARDRATNSIVLSIRGTMSAFDTLTDLVCEYEQWKGGFVHKGMKSSALWFFRNVAPQLIAYTNQHATSALYIVGHSLGSSTAAILTIMLLDYIDEFRKSVDNDSNQDFQIKCFGYAPACGLSLDLSERYKDYIQSYVFGDDVVSKMSYGSMMDVKELLIASSEAARGMSLSKVFLSGQPDDAAWKPVFEGIADCRAKCLESLANPRLYVAGTVFQFWLDPTPSNPTRMVVERTSAKQVSQELFIRRSIFLDHLPTNFDVAFTRARESLMIHGGQQLRLSTERKSPEGVLEESMAEKRGRISLDDEVKEEAHEQQQTIEQQDTEMPSVASKTKVVEAVAKDKEMSLKASDL
ncbi:unnamed protein product [Umbelopsis sp. WA50703]